MGWLAKVLGADEVIKSGFKLIDDIHTSEEEAIVAKTKAKVDLLNSYSGFKIAQRVLAIMFASTFLFSFMLVLYMSLFLEADVDVVRGVIGEFWIGEIMLTIVAFYFGGGAFEGAFRARNGGKKDEPT